MTKLEEEITKAMIEAQWGAAAPDSIIIELMAEGAAEVAKKYIEKAFYANPGQREQELCGMVSQEELFHKWLKENCGISE